MHENYSWLNPGASTSSCKKRKVLFGTRINYWILEHQFVRLKCIGTDSVKAWYRTPGSYSPLTIAVGREGHIGLLQSVGPHDPGRSHGSCLGTLQEQVLPVLHRWVPSVRVGGCHGGWDVWSITDLVTVGNSDVEQVGECCYNATDVLKTIIKTNLCLHLTGSSDSRNTNY